MFDALILGKFSKKCKQAVRCIKLRMERIKKKKRVVVRILKKDVADLIDAGHESSGFGRMDTLIVEINLVSCYETIEKLCECILSQLPTLQKQRECPDESKEAISTLIYAAARFSDLPELRDLRSLFVERYGSCMESSVNAEFAEKTKRKYFSREWKLKAMQDIADEFSVSWSAKKGEEESCNQTGSGEQEEEIDEHQVQTETVKPKPVNNAATRPYGKQNGIDKTRGKKKKNEEENNVIEPNMKVIGVFHAEKPKPFSVRRQFQQSSVSDTEDNVITATSLPRDNQLSQALGTENNVITSLDREDLDSYMALGYGKFLRRPSSGDQGQEKGDIEVTRDERDEEEKILDDLLLYYSRKGIDTTTIIIMEDCEHQHGNREGHQDPRIKVPPPKRTSSLPLESASPAEPDTRSHCRGRVHPRLPDYDQLAARFAALKNG